MVSLDTSPPTCSLWFSFQKVCQNRLHLGLRALIIWSMFSIFWSLEENRNAYGISMQPPKQECRWLCSWGGKVTLPLDTSISVSGMEVRGRSGGHFRAVSVWPMTACRTHGFASMSKGHTHVFKRLLSNGMLWTPEVVLDYRKLVSVLTD